MAAYTQAQVDAFQVAIVASGGAKTITFGDQTIEFESLAARDAFLAVMKRSVAQDAGTRQSCRLAATSKGV
jgi:hypothetical protein